MPPRQVPTQETIGARLAQLRRERSARLRRDILQAEIAEAVGTTAPVYSRWETDQRVPGDDFLAALAKYFGVTRAYLRYGDEGTHSTPLAGVAVDEGVSPTEFLAQQAKTATAKGGRKQAGKRGKAS